MVAVVTTASTSATGQLHILTVTVKGRDDLCLRAVPQPALGRPEKLADAFELVSPADTGRVLARSVQVIGVREGCSIEARFRIATALGRLSFYDATTGAIWFGFNSQHLPRLGWHLTLIDQGAK